ncbi:MAG: CotH kinase family protein [Alistipes sp.]|nr:CotH kinase family protein [Alistipes sp.]
MRNYLSRALILLMLCFATTTWSGCEEKPLPPTSEQSPELPEQPEEPENPTDTPEEQSGPKLMEFRLRAEENGDILSAQVRCEIGSDRSVSSVTPIKTLRPVYPGVTLKPVFKAEEGCKIYVGDQEQISGESAQDFTTPVIYKVVDSEGQENLYTVALQFHFTGLPIVAISTEGGVEITSKDDWVGATFSLMGSEEFESIEPMDIQIAGRGNSTWRYDKKPYKLKFASKTEVLGMPKHKRWVLLANFIDATMLRNDLTFYLGKKTSLPWTPRGYHVELVLNGKHLGNYYLCEQIKIDKNRVNITELAPEDTNITGGYLMEMDTYAADDDETLFNSKHKVTTEKGQSLIPIKIKDPEHEDLTAQQLDYIQGYFHAFEDALYGENWLDKEQGYKNYIDVTAFVDIYLISELIYHWEWRHPKSSYMHKDRDGLLVPGPLWDYDWKTYTQREGWYCKEYLWYPRLFQDPEFVALLKERWTALYPEFEGAIAYINTMKAKLAESAKKNSQIWGATTTGPNGESKMSYDQAVERILSCYTDRLHWLDSQIKAL